MRIPFNPQMAAEIESHSPGVTQFIMARPASPVVMMSSAPRISTKDIEETASKAAEKLVAEKAAGHPVDQSAREQYAADMALYMRAGISEEDFITSQRIAAGLEQLVVR